MLSAFLLALTVVPVPFGSLGPGDIAYTINASFAPDGNAVYISKSESGWAGLTLFVARRHAGAWAPPEVAPFSGRFVDTDPAVTPDGRAVVFASKRPAPGKGADTYSLFEAFVGGPRAGSVVALHNSANGLGDELYPSIARDGSMYFSVVVGKQMRVYRAASVDAPQASPVVIPGDAGGISDADATIDPAGKFLVFSSKRSDSLGRRDLYVTFRDGARWCAPVHVPEPVNSTSVQIATGLSRDGRTLYFASNRHNVDQPFAQRVDAAAYRAMVEGYSNGVLRTYSADIGAWLDSIAPKASSC